MLTMSECFKAICLYYGKSSMVDNKPVRIPREYDPVIGKDVADWMRTYRTGHEDFQPLFDKLKETYSATYGKLPDRARLQFAAEAVESLRGTSGELVSHRPVEENTEPDLSESEKIAALEEIMMLSKYGKRVERSEPYRD